MPRPSSAVAGLKSHAVPQPEAPVDLRLDGNEGAAPDAAIFDALREAGPELARRYPDARALETCIAETFDLPREGVLVTAGADEALDRVCRAFLEPGREIVLPAPGFEMLEKYARLAGATVVEYEWLRPELPVDAVRAAITPRTAIVAIVSPNNPTGLAASAEAFDAVATSCGDALLLVDLAYAEFAELDLLPLARRYEHAIVVRSLSKSWGIAGLRTGFAYAKAPWIDWLRVAGSPYSVAGPSLRLAEAWLRSGRARVADFVQATATRRARISAALVRHGAHVWPSQANFVLARFADGARIARSLAAHGIAVRTFPGRRRLESCVRISCPASDADTDRLLAALERANAEER